MFKNISRRKFLGAAALSATAAGVAYTKRWNLFEWALQLQKFFDYGSIRNPDYKVTHRFAKDAFDWTDQNMDAKTIFLKSQKEKLEDLVTRFESEYEQIKAEYPKAKSEDDSIDTITRVDNYFSNKSTRYVELNSRVMENVLDIGQFMGTLDLKSLFLGWDSVDKSGLETDIRSYGDLIQNAKGITKVLTGKELPEKLQFEFDNNLSFNLLGQYSWVLDRITLRQEDYVDTLLTLIHEIGHAIYQGGESEGFLNPGPDTKPFEEAAAYLFMTIGAQYIRQKHPELKSIVESKLITKKTSFIMEYGKGDTEEHAKGWALAHSIANHFNGDYVEAFNYITTRKSLSELDKDILENYRSIPDITDEVKDSIKAVYSEIDQEAYQITVKYLDLAEKFNPIGYPIILDALKTLISK